MSDKELQLHIRAVILLVFVMLAIAMMGMVARQNWNSKVTAYPTKTETAIHDYATQLLREMTLEEKVAQMMLAVGVQDGEVTAGGVLLTPEAVEGMERSDVTGMVGKLQETADIPLLIAVNEEGGRVNTLSQNPKLRSVPYLSPKELMTTGGMGLVETDTKDKCSFLREMGVNVNLAPVCHVTTDQAADWYGRALGGDGDATARYVETVVTAMEEERIAAALKHFPGYGNGSGEAGVFTDTRSLEQLETEDLLPFVRGLKAGADMVVMGDSVVTAIDPNAPAVLSRKVHQYLRRSYGFDGVVIGEVDERLAQYGTGETLAVSAIQAGCDMLLTEDWETQIPTVVQAVLQGDIARERIDESVLRILKLKIELNLMQ